MREENLSTLQLPTFSIGVMTDVLKRAGIDPGPALEEIGLEVGAPLPSSGFVSATAEIAFERAFHGLTLGRRDLWTEVGRRQCLAAYGLFGLATSTSPTLRDFVKISGKTRDFCYSFAEYLPVERDGKLCGIEMCLDAVPEDLREMTYFRDLGAMISAFENIWRDTTRGFCLALTVSRDEAEFMYKSSRFKLRFDRPRTMLTWPAGATDLPLSYGNDYLHQYYLSRCEDAGQGPRNDLAARITRMITLQPSAHGAIDAVARRLNMSVRTLQRRLGEDGLSFRLVLTRAQSEIARTHLKDSSMSIAQIAAHLGYADRASFDLAFSHWTGTSPRKFRDTVRQSAAADT
jgi:AraC-like DNA-binding protein